MNRRLLYSFVAIMVLFFVSVYFFSEEYFFIPSEPIHHLENSAFVMVILSIGVILSAMMYNLPLFLYTKQKPYLWYSLTQISALVFLVTLDSIYVSPFDQLFGLKVPILFDISQIFIMIFSALFLQAFLQAYEIKNLHLIVRYVLFFSFVDLLLTTFFSYAIISRFIPVFIPIALILIEAIIDAKKRDFPFYILITAWSIVILVVVLEYIGVMKMFGITFPFFHIALALESVMLSVAIAYKFRLLQQEKEEQKALLIQQSRLANMGEMISSIVHQWRQPLNVLSFGLMNIKNYSNQDEQILKTVEKLYQQLHYMSKTMEDFRNFYNPSKNRKNFNIYDAVIHAKTISMPTLQKNAITIDIIKEKDFEYFGVQNELEQVILTIILNAKDALIEKSVLAPKITIKISNPTITIIDNAAAINPKYIKKIFDSYFTTKKQGDGLGLYIAKMIIENEMKGTLSVSQCADQTLFVINL